MVGIEMDKYGREMAEIYEAYHDRMSVHEAAIREMYRKVLVEETESYEDESSEEDAVGEERD